MQINVRRLAAIVPLLVAVSLLFSFLSSLNFSKTGFEGFIGEGFKTPQNAAVGSATGSATSAASTGGASYDQGVLGNPLSGGGGFNPPNVPLFYVEGLDETTNYLRLYTATKYDGGWAIDEVVCSQVSVPRAAKVYRVTPIVNLTGHLPVAKDTKAVLPEIYDCYDANSGTFSLNSTRQPYYGFSDARNVKPTKFDGEISYDDEKLKAIAKKIVASATTDYEKVELIARWLAENYECGYEEFGKDFVREFLFEKRRGTCREFASAFVLLAQSVGIPARLVFGYIADPVPRNQTVFASDACFWAEVRFVEGWVEFDPTPPCVAAATATNITYVDRAIIGGEEFRIEGVVRSEVGNPSGFVEVFLKRNKSEDGILVGVLPVEDGKFSGTLIAPNTTGRYSVVAHYVGSRYFAESWSDPVVEVYCRPVIDVEIPDRIATRSLLFGRVLTAPPYNGELDLCVDGECRRVKVEDGNFSALLSLEPGNATIKLAVRGEGYILPAEVSKNVEVAELRVAVETVREGERIRGIVTFGGEPVNATMIFGGVMTRIENGRFEVGLDLDLGKNEVSVAVPEFLYVGNVTVFVKRPVTIDAEIADGKLLVYVHDGTTPADGYVSFGDLTKKLENGRAEFPLPESFVFGRVKYHGSEKYFAASRDVSVLPLPLIAAAIIAIAAAAIAAMAFRRRIAHLEIRIKKEHPLLPNVWEPGEVVEVEVAEAAELEVDGKKLEGGRFRLTFSTPGLRRIVATRREGRTVKRGEVIVKIAPYVEGVAEVLRMLEELAGGDATMTAREIAAKLGLKDSKIVRYFELARYGGRRLSRGEFLEAFREYLEVVGGEGS